MLKKIRKPIIKKEICSFDIETYGRFNKFVLGSISFGSGENSIRNETFHDIRKMQKAVLSLSNCSIFATNLLFDFFALFPDKDDYKGMDFMFHNGNLLKVGIKDKKMEFLDSMNFCKLSVDKMGQIINQHKLKKPDFLGEKPKTKAQLNELIEYNKRDSEITKLYMIRLQNILNNLGCEMKITISSTALNLWNRKYYDIESNPIYSPDYDIIDLMRKCYFGGRTECFYRGTFKKPLKLYDINSMYSYAMLKEYPDTRKMHIKNDPGLSDIDSFGFSYAEVESPENMFYPFLPFRSKDNKLIFPLGRWEGWFVNAELKEAIKYGYSVKPIKSYIYPKSYFPFRDYITDLYKLRIENPGYSDIYKILMNSLYGKWGQKNTDIQCFIPEMNMKDSDYMLFRKDKQSDIEHGFYIFSKKAVKPDFSMPIFSAYTTAYSRILLYKYLIKYDAVYCDTDSILTEKAIPESTELGKMKLEKISKRTILIKPKFYHLLTDRDIIKAKGLRNLNNLTFQDILDGFSVKQTKFVRFRESIRRDLKVNQIIEFNKSVDLNDNKRKWHNKLFALHEWERSSPLIIKSKDI